MTLGRHRLRAGKSGWYGILAGILLGTAILLVTAPWWDDGPQGSESAAQDHRRQLRAGQPQRAPRELRRSIYRLGSEKEMPYEERLALILKLERDLSPDEIELILQFLETARPGSESMGAFGHLINEGFNLLHRQPEQSPQMAALFVALAESPDSPRLIRDYALQHLPRVWQRGQHQPKVRSQVEGVLWRAVRGRHPSRSATALVALHNLGSVALTPSGRSGPRAIASEALQEVAVEMLRRPHEAPAGRMAALRVLSERRLQAGSPLVRSLAADDRQTLAVRLAAIAALGHLGTAADRPLLEGLVNQPLLQRAAQGALRSLERGGA